MGLRSQNKGMEEGGSMEEECKAWRRKRRRRRHGRGGMVEEAGEEAGRQRSEQYVTRRCGRQRLH